ncbi:hypothetical protein C0J52_28153 [Blattella germanica]|nr:hypothetical protein C0J52_28153 [Blattella germanica]
MAVSEVHLSYVGYLNIINIYCISIGLCRRKNHVCNSPIMFIRILVRYFDARNLPLTRILINNYHFRIVA